jgi:hypothetical protein
VLVLDNLKLAWIVWLAVTFVKVYELRAPFDTPSTTTLLITYPEFGVMTNDLLDPDVTAHTPVGDIEPPDPADAVIV